ncbi:hypothetical protein NDU88_003611 [Pleurodeles waltl]|uniref:Uncharacterized protein n=1 Tax=Pleurodeles waltl TaxID=8319 RepID=A0AAV7MR76_PLEWA|nr:hypothetical protein NDU88_003611 [Pleurodeles waltl]
MGKRKLSTAVGAAKCPCSGADFMMLLTSTAGSISEEINAVVVELGIDPQVPGQPTVLPEEEAAHGERSGLGAQIAVVPFNDGCPPASLNDIAVSFAGDTNGSKNS